MAEPENYGKKIDFNPQWKGPLQKERVKTDFPFLVSLGVYILVWMGIAIYAYSNGENIINVKRSKRSIKADNDDIFSKISIAKNIAFGFSVLSVFLSLVYIILLRWFAKVIVYTAITVICVILFGGICASSYLYAASYQNSFLLIPLSISVIIFLIVVIVTFALRKKINIACEVISESSKAVMFFPSSLLFPVLPCILYLIISLFTLSVYIYLSTISSNNGVPGYIAFFHYVNYFGFLWLTFFVKSFMEMVLSGTFATWYWSLDKNNVPSTTIVRFMNITCRYHLGTLAFGSLILAICRMINILLSCIRRRLQGSCNPFICCCFNWYKYLFGNLERLVNYINKNAYIMSSIHGTGFFQSAKDAFNLLMRNIIKVLVINKVTDVILFLGQLLTIGLSLFATWGYCSNEGLYIEMFPAMTMVLVAAVFITLSFFLVLQTAINTIFLCVLEDSERNDGSPEKPYFMNDKLKHLLLK